MKKVVQTCISMLIMLAMLTGVACAEMTPADWGNIPERGLVFPLTEADGVELGIGFSYLTGSLKDILDMPILYINLTDTASMEAALAAFTPEELANPDNNKKIWDTIAPFTCDIYCITLINKEYYDAKMAANITMESVLEVDKVTVLGENDGYVYLGMDGYDMALANAQSDEQRALFEKGIARCKELIANLTFQPIVFAETDFTKVPENALTFTTQDLNGNTVTEDLFLGKKLTVLNVWATDCMPCVNEMPDLAAWSQSMPEGVQLVGLVDDLNSYDNTELLDLARYICDATGANVFTHLVAGEDFQELLDGIVGAPTTLFIDGTGAFVGTPISGANIDACKAFVDAYLAE